MGVSLLSEAEVLRGVDPTCLVSPVSGTHWQLSCAPKIRAGAATVTCTCAREGVRTFNYSIIEWFRLEDHPVPTPPPWAGARSTNLLKSWSILSRKPCNLLKGLKGGRMKDLFPPLNKNNRKRFRHWEWAQVFARIQC